jgi:hypothetical protein
MFAQRLLKGVSVFFGVLPWQYSLPAAGLAQKDGYPNLPVQVAISWRTGSSNDLNSRIMGGIQND